VLIDDCLTVIDQLTPIITPLARDLLAHARPDPRVQALMALAARCRTGVRTPPR
jgi:hypothetical protein